MTKRIVSILVAVFMVMALIPMTALAKDSASRNGDVQKLNEVRSAAKPAKTAAVTFDFEYSSEAELTGPLSIPTATAMTGTGWATASTRALPTWPMKASAI